MKLTIISEGKDFLQYECDKFSGFEVYEFVVDTWGRNWETYIVLNGSTILENVINPCYLEPTNIH